MYYLSLAVVCSSVCMCILINKLNSKQHIDYKHNINIQITTSQNIEFSLNSVHEQLLEKEKRR